MSRTYIYAVQSVQTGYYIISTEGDVAGQNVATADGNGGLPAGTFLNFNKVLADNTTDVTIKGASGLYVALPEVFSFTPSSSTLSNLGYKQNATSGSKLVWSNDAANWQVDNTSGVYEIFPEGQDLYWMTDKATGPTVEVKKGSEVIEKENKWTITRIDREERASA
ncbi:hypothetical protein ARMSODRAFT_973993 [Armillaria solidipes]|uniref:Ricin B lectin domain-containing protein n=1 Tax=Armillaria solidipes TaxID=1076256 RepID=A0A2H3BIQ9_9AGAR|nr:hypothetical protein ARMSODRAFT_973993 [Armillaria solidipes]